MNQYSVQWTPTQAGHLAQERYAHFFALVQGPEVLYIGQSYQKDLSQLIPACIAGLDLDHLPLKIYLGRIREVGMGRISCESVASIHELLVFGRKPRLNATGKLRYEGVADLRLANDGCTALPNRLRAENKLVFVGRPS